MCSAGVRSHRGLFELSHVVQCAVDRSSIPDRINSMEKPQHEKAMYAWGGRVSVRGRRPRVRGPCNQATTGRPGESSEVQWSIARRHKSPYAGRRRRRGVLLMILPLGRQKRLYRGSTRTLVPCGLVLEINRVNIFRERVLFSILWSCLSSAQPYPRRSPTLCAEANSPYHSLYGIRNR